ncbi:inner membrane peptidase [Moraxella macacae 0408225]|uniref:Inner membrane peptidase n=1 Tax=Moraxella macacae 0408225 TaxID=1230338 RepID=L2F4W9_9GAMM|nr:protease SohB [Moraxella macacae]ELA08064.1 inner membrane peptidase [Moraxella macacae 0408225]
MLFQSQKQPTELKITHLNKVQNQHKQQLMLEIANKKAVKQFVKQILKDTAKLAKNKDKPNNVYVLDFHGDIKASDTQQLREEISVILSTANQGDEVVVRLESPGGMVHGYGLAAAQLARIKEAGLYLTVCVDKVAASGGYMMACVADKIVCAPFAVVGSIGVVAQVPNFYDFLQKHDVDMNVFTAGKYKRTVTVFGKNDAEDKQKFQQELEQTHQLFQDFVTKYRPQLELDKVATGETWYGEDAIGLKLVDKLQTSDSYLLDLLKNHQVYALHTRKKPTLAEKLGFAQVSQNLLKTAVDTAVDKMPDVLATLENSKLPMFKAK